MNLPDFSKGRMRDLARGMENTRGSFRYRALNRIRRWVKTLIRPRYRLLVGYLSFAGLFFFAACVYTILKYVYPILSDPTASVEKFGGAIGAATLLAGLTLIFPYGIYRLAQNKKRKDMELRVQRAILKLSRRRVAAERQIEECKANLQELDNELRELQQEATDFEMAAMQFLQDGQEDDARRFLTRKISAVERCGMINDNISMLSDALLRLENNAEAYREQIKAIKSEVRQQNIRKAAAAIQSEAAADVDAAEKVISEMREHSMGIQDSAPAFNEGANRRQRRINPQVEQELARLRQQIQPNREDAK